MKTTIKILAVSALAAGIMSSSAYAGGDQRVRQIGEENAAYFARMGHHTSSGAVMSNPDYQFTSRPEQRMAMRNADYFAKIGYKGGEMRTFNKYTDVSEYPFSGSVLSAERGGYVFSSAIKR